MIWTLLHWLNIQSSRNNLLKIQHKKIDSYNCITNGFRYLHSLHVVEDGRKSTILMTTSTEILSICSLNPKNLCKWSSSFRPIWRTEIIKICVSFNKRWSRFKFCHPLVWSLVSLHDINDPLLQCDNDYTWSILSQYYSDGETSLSNNVPPALPTYNIITTLLYLPDTTYRVKIKIKRISLKAFQAEKKIWIASLPAKHFDFYYEIKSFLC